MKRRTLRSLAAVMSVSMMLSLVAQYPLEAGLFDGLKNIFGTHKVQLKGNYAQTTVYDGKYLTPSNGSWVEHNGQKLWIAELGNVQTGTSEVVALDQKQYAQFVGNETVMKSVGATPNPKLGFFSKIKGFFTPKGSAGSSAASSNSGNSGSTDASASSGSNTSSGGETAGQVSGDSSSSNSGNPSFGSKMKDSYQSGYEKGNNAGNKAYDGVKGAGGKVVDGAKGAGSKIGDFFKNIGSKFKKGGSNTAPNNGSSNSGSDSSSGSNNSNSSSNSDSGSNSGNSNGNNNGTVAGDSQSGNNNSGSNSSSAGSDNASAGSSDGKPSIGDKIKDGWKKGFDTGKNIGKKGSSSSSNGSVSTNNPADSGVREIKIGEQTRYQDTKTGRFITKTEAMAKMGAAGGSDNAQSGGEKKSWLKERMEKIKGNTETGFSTGKGFAKAGVENVKASLSSGFSAKNILVTAGITTAIELGKQLSSGQRPDLGKAVKMLVSAEFVGGFTGSVLGGAAGSFLTPALSAIPVVGGFLGALAPAMGSVAGFMFGGNFAGGLKQGRMSFGAALRAIDWWTVAGQGAGSVLGGMLGSFLGPIGSIVGSMIGGYIGAKVAGFLKGVFGRRAGANGGMGNVNYDSAGGLYQGGNLPSSSYTPSFDASSNNNGAALPAYQDLAPDQSANSDIQAAHMKVTELYKLYSSLIGQAKHQEAQAVLKEYNSAKLAFENLKSASGE